MMNYVQDQKDLLNGIYEETFKNLKNLKELLKDEPNVNVTMYGENIIVETNKELSEKYDNFYDDLYRIQKHKFRFQVSSLVLHLFICVICV